MVPDMRQLTPQQFEAFGAEMDAIHRRVMADLGADDANYIRQVARAQRHLELLGRGLLFAGFLPPAWLGGVAALSLSKIINTMELGHNILHGQYDFVCDEVLNSRDFEWDMVSPAELWKRNHNFPHHAYTNILGKDRDIFVLLRTTPLQPWRPYYLGNPVYAVLLSLIFEWAVMLHDIEWERILSGEKSREEIYTDGKKMVAKVTRQLGRDYLLFPALSGPLAPLTFVGNATANLARNIWAFAIIFSNHFPEGTVTFTAEETADESRGQWYVRQLHGAANLTGSKLFHLLAGNLSYHIEHHMFPDIPAWRYAHIAEEVRDACRRYGLPYNAGTLRKQLGSTFRKLVKFALPGTGSGAAQIGRREGAARPAAVAA